VTLLDATQNGVMQSGAGVQRSGTLVESKHPYPGTTAAPDKRAIPMLWFRSGNSTMTDPDCLFCRIIRGEIPCRKVHEDDHVLAFEDIHPQAPTHVLVIPKRHFAGLKEAEAADAEIIGRCHLAAAQIARQRKIEQGYRTVLNVGPGAGQSVFHLHVHLLGGRPLMWPPG